MQYYAQDKKGKQIPLTHSLLDQAGGTGSVYTEEFSGKGVAALRRDFLQLENKQNQLALQFNDNVGGLFVDSSQIDFTYDPDVPSITGTIINNSITNSHLAPLPAGAAFKGNTNIMFGGGPQDLTPTQAVSLLQNFEWSFSQVNTGRVRGPTGANNSLRLQPGDSPSKGILIDNNTGTTTINKTTNIGTAQLQIVSDVNEVIRAETASATGNPLITLVQANTVRSRIWHDDNGDRLTLESFGGNVVIRPGSGSSAERLTIAESSSPTVLISSAVDEGFRVERSGQNSILAGFHNSDGRRFFLQWDQSLTSARFGTEFGALRFLTGLSGTAEQRMLIDAVGNVGIGTTVMGGRLRLNQGSTTGIIPVLTLNQADVSEEFINFEGIAGASNAINTSALGAYLGKLRIRINGSTTGYIPYYA